MIGEKRSSATARSCCALQPERPSSLTLLLLLWRQIGQYTARGEERKSRGARAPSPYGLLPPLITSPLPPPPLPRTELSISPWYFYPRARAAFKVTCCFLICAAKRERESEKERARALLRSPQPRRHFSPKLLACAKYMYNTCARMRRGCAHVYIRVLFFCASDFKPSALSFYNPPETP